MSANDGAGGRPRPINRRTALELLKSCYDQETFSLLVREFYSTDRATSLAAINSSASLGNEAAVPHLYRIIDSASREQKVAAVRALAAIKAPSSIDRLLKYYALFDEPELKAELLAAVNTIDPRSSGVQELDRNVAQTPAAAVALVSAALVGLVDAGRLDLVRQHVTSVAPDAQIAVLRRVAQGSLEAARGVAEALRNRGEALAPAVLGRSLAVAAAAEPPARHVLIVERIRRSPPEAVRGFIDGLAELPSSQISPKNMFRLALLVPHVDAASEAVLGGFVERIAQHSVSEQSIHIPYYRLTVSTHLDTTFARVRKGFLSIREAKARGSLLIIILAKLIERYASPELLQRIQGHFQGSLLATNDDLAAELATAMADAPAVDRNRLKAAASLFATRSARVRILVSSQLSCINLDRPNLIRRLNRLVRVAGLLGARGALARIAETLAFARSERISFLEETSVLTLCQLGHRKTLEDLGSSLSDPACAQPTLNGYLRGVRYLPPKLLTPAVARVLLRSDLPAPARSLILETLEAWDLGDDSALLPPLLAILNRGVLAPAEAARVGSLLARRATPANASTFIDMSQKDDPLLKLTAARALRRIAARGEPSLRDVLTGRLYALLDSHSPAVEVQANLALVMMGDEYARQVLAENLRRADEAYLCALLPELDEEVDAEMIPDLLALLSHPSPRVQALLRDALARQAAGRFGEPIRAGLIASLKGTNEPPPARAAAPGPATVKDLAERAKSEFRFRRENAQVLTVLFVDMVGYTERTSTTDTVTMLGLIQTFEDIVLPQVDGFDGRLIKKMGDGALAVFKHPLKATLAALAIQGRIRAHNEFRVDNEKLHVRIGLNTGLVVRKGGDIFGDVVNVASRMETSANPGEILLTQETYQEIRDHVVCTPLGGIQVKGKKEPIMAYAATEVLGGIDGKIGSLGSGTERQLAELNLTETIVAPAYVFPEAASVEPSLAQAIGGIFQDITRAGEELTRDYHEENAFKRYLQGKWDELVRRIVESRPL